MTYDDKTENFIQAFRSGHGSCCMDCGCGKTYYNSDGGWTWEEGELEQLEKSDATDLPHTVESICFEGGEYVIDCPCWQERAKKLMVWIDAHGRRIAEYLTLEKQRKTKEAERSPVVA